MEYFDVLDDTGNKTGQQKLRSEVHRDGDWHRCVHVWIVNDRDEVLLQRRCPTKDSHPNMLDISCAGHLITGDDSVTGAMRELKEELSLDIAPEDLHFMKTFKHNSQHTSDFINNEFDDMYILRTNKNITDMKFQKDEISEIFFVPLNEFKQMVTNKQPDLLMHDDEFEVLFDWLDKREVNK